MRRYRNLELQNILLFMQKVVATKKKIENDFWLFSLKKYTFKSYIIVIENFNSVIMFKFN